MAQDSGIVVWALTDLDVICSGAFHAAGFPLCISLAHSQLHPERQVVCRQFTTMVRALAVLPVGLAFIPVCRAHGHEGQAKRHIWRQANRIATVGLHLWAAGKFQRPLGLL